MSGKAKEGANLASKMSTASSGASSNGEAPSKSTPLLRRARLKKEDKDTVVQTNATLPFEVDESAREIRVVQGTPIFGTTDLHSIQALINQLRNASPNNGNSSDLQSLKWSAAMVEGIAPKNPLEGLLAVQMIGVHNLAMECLRRASLKEQTPEGIDMNVHRAVRLLRTFTSQMEALNRNRGKVSQQMVVGNVNVNEGGQAIVGSVEHHGGEKAAADHDTKKNK